MIPILQSGLIYPGKQALIKYFMLIPTPAKIRNDEVGKTKSSSLSHLTLFESSGFIKFIASFSFYAIPYPQRKEPR